MTEQKPEDVLCAIDPISNAVYSFDVDELVKMTYGATDLQDIGEDNLKSFVSIMASLLLEHGREPKAIG